MTWTHFYDMHSGGSTKEPPWQHIFIEAPEDEAKVIFYNRFEHNPERVTCTCCGDDYVIYEGETLQRLTAFHRNCQHGWLRPDGSEFIGDPRELVEPDALVTYKPVYAAGWSETYFERPDPERLWAGEYLTLEAYLAQPDVLVIRADEIKADERAGSVPEQGYVWVE